MAEGRKLMVRDSNVIKQTDYEKYQIIIPFLSAAGKRRRQFLSSELEKLHPCFSNEFAFDSNITKIKRNGFCSDVYVVNKYKLAEYERKRSLSGRGFYVEKKKKWVWGKRRLFVDKKWKLSIFTLCAVFLLAAGGIFFGLHTGHAVVKEAVEKSESEGLVNETDRGVDRGVINQSACVEDMQLPIAENFLKAVSESGGKIAWFEWSLNGYTQTLSASVSGVYPESLMTSGKESVIYENGIPKMKVSYSSQLSTERNSFENTILSNHDFNKELRNVLTEAGVKLIAENAPPYHIEFLYKPGISFENLFDLLDGIISGDRRVVSYVSINQTTSSYLQVGLSIESIPLRGFDLKLLSGNLNLFIDETKRVSDKASTITSREIIASESNKQEKDTLIKIGEIRRADKSTVVFFKNSEGKIKEVISKKED